LSNYELMYILSPEVEEEDLQAVVDRISQIITDGGGEVLHLESWGRKRLAYQIRRFREGHYILAYIQLDPGAVSQLRARFALTEEMIRYLLLRTDELPARVAEAASREERAPAKEIEAEPESEPVEEAAPAPEDEPAESELADEEEAPDADGAEPGD
jgi:small subunit ribosomal protein S6